MKRTFQKQLLAGAIAAAMANSALSVQLDLNGNEVWAGTAGQNGGSVSNAQAGDDVQYTADNQALFILNDAVANDGSANVHTFRIGAITSDFNNSNVLVRTLSNTDLTVTINSIDGIKDFNLESDSNNGVTTTVTHNFNITGTLRVDDSETVIHGARELTLLLDGEATAGEIKITGGQTAGIRFRNNLTTNAMTLGGSDATKFYTATFNSNLGDFS